MDDASITSALLDAIDGGDVGVVLRGRHPGFALDAHHVLSIVGQRRGESTLMATSRLSLGSRARYTSPMPPAPTGPRISDGPSRRLPKVAYA
jgi:hypothetical protein